MSFRGGIVTAVTAGTGLSLAGGDGAGHGALTLSVGPSVAVVQENTETANSGGAYALPDVTAATIHRITLTANCTLTFPAAAAGKSFLAELVQDATGSRLATWPANVKWAAGTAPTLTTAAAKGDLLGFYCLDGANWLGAVVAENY